MKRVISLVLAIVSLLSVTVIPVAAEGNGPSVSLSVVPVSISDDGDVTELTGKDTYGKDDYIMLKVSYENDATARFLQVAQFAVKYDSDALTAVQKKIDGETWGPGINVFSSRWTAVSATPDSGVATISTYTSGSKEIAANGTLAIAGFLFQVNSAAETGDYHFAFDMSREQSIGVVLNEADKTAIPVEGIDFANTTVDVAITGNTPTLNSVEITPSEQATYGEEKTYTLKALSTSGKDITNLVETWSVAKKDGETEASVSTITFSNDKKTMTVGNTTDAGAYKITATYDGISPCGEITVNPAEISSMAFSLTAPVKNATPGQADSLTTGITVTETEWYKVVADQNDPVVLVEGEKFAPSTVYQAKISYDTDKNHIVPLTTEEKPNIDTTISGATLNKNNDRTVWCTFPETLAADPVTITVTGTFTATYGQKLSEIEPSDYCSATFNNEKVTGKFEWENGNQLVGNVGTHEYTVVFTPNDAAYAVTRQTVSVTVNPASIAGAAITKIPTQEYTGKEIEPAPEVKLGGKTLVRGTDYEVTYSTNINVGTATVTITGQNNFTGTQTVYFQITKSIASCDITLRPAEGTGYTYTGNEIKPTVTVKDGDKPLTQDTDYTVSYSGNTNAGLATVTVTGQGNYTGSVEKNFTIEPQVLNITTDTITIPGTFTYDGTAKEPNVPTLTVGRNEPVKLTLNEDYTVEYRNNVNAGDKAEITFKPKTGSNYTFDQFTLNFTIGKATLQNVETTKTMNIRYGVTTPQTFSDWGLPADVAFTAELGTTTDSGIISGDPTLDGTTLSFTPKSTTSADVNKTATIPVTFSSTNYNDFTITLTVTIVNKLNPDLMVTSLTDGMSMIYGDEKTVTWSVAEAAKGGEIVFRSSAENVIKAEGNKITAAGVGTATITVTYDSADYYDQKTFNITVNKKPIIVTADNMTIAYGDNPLGFSYTYPDDALVGNDRLNIKPETTATKTSPVGTYDITLAEGEGGNPNYNVKLNPGTLTITKAPLTITNATVEGKTYDGTNTATVTGVTFEGLKNEQSLTLDTDYTVSGEFKDANAGVDKEVTVTVTLSTTGTAANYELKVNTLTAKSTIEKRTTQVKITEIKDAVYTGKPYARENYTVNSENAVFKFFKADGNRLGDQIDTPTDVGEYYINAIVNETDNEKESGDSAKFAIKPRPLTDAGVTVADIPDQTYTGLQITPAVTVKYNGMTLTKGTDYTVVASGDCTNVGTATVHINGKGNYSGTIEKTFTIVPKLVEGATVTFSNETLTYNGEEQHPETITVGHGATGFASSDYTVAYSDNVNAGTATATVTFKGNYSGTATGTFTIAPKTIDDLTWTGDTFYYDKNEKTVTATANGLIGEDTATVTVKGGKQTAIGSYIATATAISNANYQLKDGLTHNFTIKNAIESISVTSPATVSATVDGLTIKLVGTKMDNETVGLKINNSEQATTIANDQTSVEVNSIPYKLDKSDLKETPNDVTLAEKPAEVSAPETASDDTKQAVATIKEVGGTKSEGLAAAAASAITEEAKSKNTDETQNTVTATTKLEIEVQNYEKSAEEGKSVLTLEITPKVTYTYTDKDGKEQEETETISNSDIKAPVTISVKLPEGMPTTNLFVKHELKNGGVEYLKVTVTNGVATWQQSSFSTAILMSDNRTVTITLVKGNGEKITMDLDLSSIGTVLPKDGNKTNWKFDGIDGSYSTITNELFETLAEKGDTITATSVSGSSSEPDDKPSRPGSSSSSGPLLPSTGADELAFRDVSKYDYYYNAVKWAVKKGVTSGTGRYTFSPDDACTRAQTVTFLWRAAGCPKASTKTNPFTDVAASDYFYEAVLWAVENGITNGTSSTTFSPNASVTRAQVAAFLWRANGEPAAKDSGFADVHANAYYAKAVAWAYAEGITTGTGFGVFSPDNVCTRAQIVTFLFRNAK